MYEVVVIPDNSSKAEPTPPLQAQKHFSRACTTHPTRTLPCSLMGGADEQYYALVIRNVPL